MVSRGLWVVSGWCLGGVSVVYGGDSSMSRWCLDGVPVVTGWCPGLCLGGFLVVSWWCLGGVSVACRWCLEGVFLVSF